ncbi:hypothetical protein [Winogradskyella alexanderae]|uniref:Lipoprotein n=1 Tax=Winogradskyella alexanderae TaxID=2877123 RepID=A0ABS7XNP6_9FLAO|nr:hypothetical protein [Winogradskyella alexanderae]MCA0131400.1 hypothetical protein [Winogradskyella alexanderae]
MKQGILILNVFLLILCACDGPNETSANENLEQQEVQESLKITEKSIEEFQFTDYVLSSDGEKAVSNWEKYQELAIQISYLKKADLSFFNGESNLITEFIEEFKSNVPEDLETNPIVSRVVVLETAMYRLNANLTLDNIEDEEKLMSVKAVLVAFSNLNNQINKKLERDIYDRITVE